MRVGIFPGTFNPLHDGHVSFALQAIEQLKLDKVLVLPERLPRYKKDVPDVEHRVAFAAEKVVAHDKIEVLSLECDYLTVEAVLASLPHIYNSHHVVMLIGSDLAKNIASWDSLGELFNNHEICVGLRGNDESDPIERIFNELREAHGGIVRYKIIETEYPEVSSTKVRLYPGYKPLG